MKNLQDLANLSAAVCRTNRILAQCSGDWPDVLMECFVGGILFEETQGAKGAPDDRETTEINRWLSIVRLIHSPTPGSTSSANGLCSKNSSAG